MPLFVDDEVVTGGAVGLRLDGVEVLPCVSQGASPVGPELTVTAAEGNVISELDGRPALEVLRDALEALPASERGAPRRRPAARHRRRGRAPGRHVALAGVAVIAGPAALSPASGTRAVAGAALVLLATLAFGGYMVVLRPLSQKYGPVSATATSSVAGALPYLALAGTAWPPRLSPPAGAELLFLALGSTVAGMLLWNLAVVRGGAGISRLLYLEPVVSVLGAMVFLGERVTAAVLAGGVLVIAGVLMTGDGMARPRRPAVIADAGPPRVSR